MTNVVKVNKINRIQEAKEEQGQLLKLTGIAHYAKVHTPQEDGNYTLALQIDHSIAEMLAEQGVPIKNKDDELEAKGKPLMGTHVTLKSQYAPKVVDANKNTIAPEILIGNGSKVNVIANIYNWKFKAKSGTGLGLRAVQVLELVEFNKNNALDLLESEKGYTILSSESGDDEVSAKFD